MVHFRRMRWSVVVWSALATAVLGCSSNSRSSSDGDATPGQTISCAAPTCCFPLDINPNKIVVYQTGGQIGIYLTLDIPVTSSEAWNASVDVWLPWGPSVTCTTGISSSSDKFVRLVCPWLSLDGAPACDSTFTLALGLRTSTYADTAGTQVICADQQGTRVELTVPMECPACTLLASSSNFQPCDFPGETCDYSAYMPSGSTGLLPCHCDLNAGDLRWSCAIP